MSASDSGNLGKLRAEVREKILVYLQESFSSGLPKVRAELDLGGARLETGNGGMKTTGDEDAGESRP